MPSSTLVACRASVMLGSLIVVPAAALFWPSFPTAVDSVLASVRTAPADGHGGPARGNRTARRELSDAPRFEVATPRGPFDFAQSAPSSLPGGNRNSGVGLPVAMAQGPSASAAVSLPRPVPPGEQPQLVPVDSQRGGSAPPWGGAPAAAANYVEPARAPVGTHPTSMRGGPPAAATNSMLPGATGGTSTPATLETLQTELRRRGATYFFLETWGSECDQFRFHCKVAVAGNTRYVRHFDATHADPLAAMRQVLNQVEAWQSGRSL